MPSGFDWPIHEGMMLGFLGQVNLAELKNCYDLGLPSHGLLSFWFHQGLNDGEGPACGKIFHFLDSDLTLLEYPDDERYDTSWILDYSGTTWKAYLSAFPSLPYGYYHDNVYREFLNLSEDEGDTYVSERDAYDYLQSGLSDLFDLLRDDYQLGGYPHRCQLDPQKYIYLVTGFGKLRSHCFSRS